MKISDLIPKRRENMLPWPKYYDYESHHSVSILQNLSVSAPLGNASDDNVDQYQYDWRYQNDLPLEEVEVDFIEKLNGWLDEK